MFRLGRGVYNRYVTALRLREQRNKALEQYGNFENMPNGTVVTIEEMAKRGNMKKLDGTLREELMHYFEPYCQKYNVQYAVIAEPNDKGENEYYVFFEGKDAATIDTCLELGIKDYEREMAIQARRDKIYDLAGEIDLLARDFDTYGYDDAVDDREANIRSIQENLENGKTKEIRDNLKDIYEESKDNKGDSDRIADRAREILDKMDKLEEEQRAEKAKEETRQKASREKQDQEKKATKTKNKSKSRKNPPTKGFLDEDKGSLVKSLKRNVDISNKISEEKAASKEKIKKHEPKSR